VRVAELHVELVSADRMVWSGEATMVIARTLEGDLGIMGGHQPLLGVLANGPVQIRSTDDGPVVAAVHGGFLSVSEDRVSILAEVAELAGEIDESRARRALEQADPEDDAATVRAQARLRALELGR
jgi:F-type H+-transporting ATPase subunit epsilon